MTKVAILSEPAGTGGVAFRAVSGGKQSVGRTAGEALDALSENLPQDDGGTIVVVQTFRPDAFFSSAQVRRLNELMTAWRSARDRGENLPAADQADLDSLIDLEVRAASKRAAAMLGAIQG